MTDKSALTKKVSQWRVGNILPKPASALSNPDKPPHADAVEVPAAIAASPAALPVPAMTTGDLISRAKQHIGTGETSRNTSFRAAAEDIARACDQGAKQREVAEGVGKSAAWVNRLLKWREGGYIGAPFADKFVQGVNDEPAAPESAPIDPVSAITALEALSKKEPSNSEGRQPASESGEELAASDAQEMVDTAPALAPAAQMPSAAHGPSDYHIPAALNRLDPERAFQRLAEQWSSNPFRDLLLNSPKASQERFLRDVLSPELGGRAAATLSAPNEGSDQ